MKIKKNLIGLACLSLCVVLSGCSTPLAQHWEDRDLGVQKKLALLDKTDPQPEELVALIQEFEKNKNDYKNGGYADFIYVKQVAVHQLQQKLKESVEQQDHSKTNKIAAAILEIDPSNENLKSIVSSGKAEISALDLSDQTSLFANLAPSSAMGASYNMLVHQSLVNSNRDGRQYRALHDTLKQPLKADPLPKDSPLIQQMSYLSSAYGFNFACDSEIASKTDKTKVNGEKSSVTTGKPTLLHHLVDLAAVNKVNFVIFPDQVYCFSGETPSKEIDGGEYLSVFRAEFVSVELLVGMLKLIVGDANIVMADEATKSVWIRSNRTKFIHAFDMARSIDFPEAEIEVQMELYEVSASLLHRIGMRVPQLIRWGSSAVALQVNPDLTAPGQARITSGNAVTTGQLYTFSWLLDLGVTASNWQVVLDGQLWGNAQTLSGGSNLTPASQSASVNIGLSDGSHVLAVRLCNAKGCTDSAPLTVISSASLPSPAQIVSPQSPVSVQLGSPVSVRWQQNGGNPGTSWKLMVSSVQQGTTQTQIVNAGVLQTGEIVWTPSAVGSYTLRVDLCSTSGCVAGTSITVSVLDGKPGNARVTGAVTALPGQAYLLSWSLDYGVTASSWQAIVDSVPVGAVQPLSGGTSLTLATQTGSSSIYLSAGVHTVNIQLCNSSGCTQGLAKSVTVQSNSAPGAVRLVTPTAASNLRAGIAASIQWDLQGAVPATSWKLLVNKQQVNVVSTDIQTSFLNGIYQQSSTTSWTPLGAGQFIIEVEVCNAQNCSVSGTTALTVLGSAPPPAAVLTSTKYVYQISDVIQLKWQTVASAAATYWEIWENGVKFDQAGRFDSLSPVQTGSFNKSPSRAGTYQYTVRLCNQAGCSDSNTVTIKGTRGRTGA